MEEVDHEAAVQGGKVNIDHKKTEHHLSAYITDHVVAYRRDTIFTGGLPLGLWSFARCHLRMFSPSPPILHPRRFRCHSPPA